MEKTMVINPVKQWDDFVVGCLVLLASFDLFRAYLDVSAINYFFAFKEVLVICLLYLLCNKSRIKITFSFLAIILLTIFYCSINVVDEDGILLLFIYLKYVIVYFLSLLIFQNLSLSVLRRGINKLLIVFFVYSIFACLHAFIFPDSMVRTGRISGFANPSFLSYIYLLCFLYVFKENRILYSIWFIIVGFLTLTKTFFVTFFVVLVYLLMFSSYRGKVLMSVVLIAPILGYVLTLNQDMYITYDRALTVLLNRDSEEYNSMNDRIGRTAAFKKNNSGNFIWGYGTGKAGSSAIFLRDKMGKKLSNLTDFENQIMNIYYSLGVLGVFLLYYPFINQLLVVYRKNIALKKKHCFYLFIIVFALYNLTLNILESFTACIITLLFLVEYGKEIEGSH